VNITLQQLKCIMPRAGVLALAYLPWLNSAMAEFGIDTKVRQAAFLAQLAHETGDLTSVVENLNYSADGLANTWPSRFARKDAAGAYVLAGGRKVPNELAWTLQRQPEKIANTVYANRMGNGSPASGDGWRHRGAGGFQLTGKDNQLACAAYFRIPFDRIGDWLRTPEGVSRSAAWCWWKAGCNKLADAGDVDGISDLVNLGHRTAEVGDAIGFADRQSRTGLADKVLA
jgi:putative chitinase